MLIFFWLYLANKVIHKPQISFSPISRILIGVISVKKLVVRIDSSLSFQEVILNPSELKSLERHQPKYQLELS